MLQGVYEARKKDGSVYYRSNITFRNKHISLGSFPSEREAYEAYCDASKIIKGKYIFDSYLKKVLNGKTTFIKKLSFEKAVIVFNFRDNAMYIANPIYLRKNFFSYYLDPLNELKFDIDDLFYYTQHRIMKRDGHFFVNDYGMQVTLQSRYGIKPYAVRGRDYEFINDDPLDFRYSNIQIKSVYNGVVPYDVNGTTRYKAVIHINGNFVVGNYSKQEKAAIAYNKAVDEAKKAGVNRDYRENYLESLSAKEYADIYMSIKLSDKYKKYLKSIEGES